MVRKGRMRSVRGARNPNVRLTSEDVIAMRAAYKAGETQQALADRYGVAQAYVSRIIRRQAWVEV